MSEDEIPKFEDAKDAGTNGGHLCTLILIDGDTSREIAIAALSVLGRNQYGMFQLLRDIYEESHEKVLLEVSEINDLMKVVGLQYNKEYSTEADLKSLRYRKLMILTDQNEEGSHFKGLLINFIYTNWPDLLRLQFLDEFITPVVKVIKEEARFSFFSFAEFEEWKSVTPDIHTYNVKYYRGLGTCTWKEVKEYFANMDRHRVVFEYNGPEDDENIIKAFANSTIKQRKEWLTHHMDECKRRKALGLRDKYLYTTNTRAITFSEFINLEYVLFANVNNIRSIPSVVDGFKLEQRKILYTCIKRNDKQEKRVTQLAYSVYELAAYYRGERSLCKKIIEMAQNYIGSNNVNLLIPIGQFGTRLVGGKDSADQYDIYTKLSTLTRLIFHPDDDPLLSYNSDENQTIEPTWYIPIIPMILVNGSEGTGTGWSTRIPNHDPHQLIRCLRKMMAGEEPELLTPHYKNFRGTIEAVGDTRYITIGCLAIVEGDKIEITELPIGAWTTSYIENVLAPLLHGTEKVKPIITGYEEFQTDTTVRLVISFASGEFEKLEREIGGFHRTFKLYGFIGTNNMYAFDRNNCLRRYENINDILKEFYNLRLEYYVKRKKYLKCKLTAEADKLSNQVKFIIGKTNNTLVVENKTRKTVIDELIQLGFQVDPVEEWKRKNGIKTEDKDSQESEQTSSKQKIDTKYDYLLDMTMWMLTEELKTDLFKQCDAKMMELNVLQNQSEYDLWLMDLEELETKLNELELTEREEKSRPYNKDLYPSENCKNIEFKITEEFIQTYCKEYEEQ